jgi:hypothetical protein
MRILEERHGNMMELEVGFQEALEVAGERGTKNHTKLDSVTQRNATSELLRTKEGSNKLHIDSKKLLIHFFGLV